MFDVIYLSYEVLSFYNVDNGVALRVVVDLSYLKDSLQVICDALIVMLSKVDVIEVIIDNYYEAPDITY